MNLLTKHTALIRTASVPVDSTTKEVGATTFSSPVSFLCLVTPLDASALYQETGLVLRNPHRLMCGNAHASKLAVNSKLTVELNGVTRHFRVTESAQTFALGMKADNTSVRLEETESDAS